MIHAPFARAIRRTLALLALSSAVLSPAMADTVTVPVAAWSSARDGGFPPSPVADGEFDALIGGPILFVRHNQGFGIRAEYRAAYEFVLPAAVLRPRTIIQSVTLTVPVAAEILLGGNATIFARSYVADGLLTLDDFELRNPAVVQTASADAPVSERSFNLTNHVRRFLQNGPVPRLGVVFNANTLGTNLLWRPGATLTIEYFPRPGNPPTLSIYSPEEGATYSLHDLVQLWADAFDPETGSLSESVVWTSSLDGALGQGAVDTSQLSPGTHVLTATVSDVDGNSVAQTRTIRIRDLENQPPEVAVIAPINDQMILAGVPFHLIATAHDPELGSLDAQISWSVDGVHVGTGPDVPVALSLGNHHVQMMVGDGFWFFTALIHVTVVTELPPPPPPE